MSYILMHKQFSSIKKRYGWSDPPRFKIINHKMHMCPGNIRHASLLGLPPMRKHRLFERHVGNRHKACVAYWRSHQAEYHRYMSS